MTDQPLCTWCGTLPGEPHREPEHTNAYQAQPVIHPMPGRTLSSEDACPVCSPVGNVYLGTDGYLSCNNCMWNSEEDEPKSRVVTAPARTPSGKDSSDD